MTKFTGWRTSTRTQGQGQCVEVGFGGGQVAIRDSKNPTVGITVSAQRWRDFLAALKSDRLG